QKYVIRFKIPEKQTIEAKDLVYGSIKVQSEDLDDFIILKSDQFPTYHLANVIDDHEMQISHVIRGEEWLPSLPKHILLYQALNYNQPNFVHLPLLLNPDKSKLSKRQGDVAVEDFLAKGYLPQAILNYVALLGWNPGDDREFFSIKELIKNFSLEKINKAGAIFDLNKLNWFNAEYIRQIIAKRGEDYQNLINQTKKILPDHSDQVENLLKLFGSRLNYLAELKELSPWLWQLPDYPTQLLIFKKSDQEKTKQGLKEVLELLTTTDQKKWTRENLDQILQQAVKNGLTAGDIFWPTRVALSGLEKSPSPAEIMEFLGKEESLERINQALGKLK
ncbi:glutamate--tRNA ligase, partial [Candidatus Roizmanbacteria bacterium CG_4_10_14_0_2_um_filter_36_9]